MTSKEKVSDVAAALADQLKMGGVEPIAQALGISGGSLRGVKRHENCPSVETYAAVFKHQHDIDLVKLIDAALRAKDAGLDAVSFIERGGGCGRKRLRP